jgi:hypothetical protein
MKTIKAIKNALGWGSDARHGAALKGRRTPEYRAFDGAKERCLNPRNKDFHRYGGRGIKFLFHSFEAFLAAVGPKPSPDHSIDRMNNEGHYAPGNVRWATRSQQASNRRPRPRDSSGRFI